MRYLGEIISLSLLLLVSCSGLRTGDLVFVRPGTDPLASSMSGAISSATGEFVHVAIVEVEDGDVWVIDAMSRPKKSLPKRVNLYQDYTTPVPAPGRPPLLEIALVGDFGIFGGRVCYRGRSK